MTMTITTEWLQSVGCKIVGRQGMWAEDLNGNMVAYEGLSGRWYFNKLRVSGFRFRVKAPSVKETTP